MTKKNELIITKNEKFTVKSHKVQFIYNDKTNVLSDDEEAKWYNKSK